MIYLITDYGEKDYFVCALKTVIINFCKILNINPIVLDITHHIDSYNVFETLLNIKGMLNTIPNKSVIVGVVDPEVGSNTAGCVSKHIFKNKEIYFIGRNNGILGAFYKSKHIFTYKINIKKIEENIKRKGIFYKAGIKQISNTFHGRDVFAPLSAILHYDIQNNTNLLKQFLSSKIKPLYHKIPPIKKENNKIIGQIIYIDKFGNLITNIAIKTIEKAKKVILFNSNQRIDLKILKNYIEGDKEDLFAVRDSFGYLEISRFRQSAEKFLENYGSIWNFRVEVIF